jgi:uridylate kinase
MRIVLRIGGSVVASPINPDLILQYVDTLKTLKDKGQEIVVVTGGGALAREFIEIAKKIGLEMNAQDELAISVSRLFAQLFAKKLAFDACDKVALTLNDAEDCLKSGKIAVMGGLKPGITTDAVAALVAERIDADLLLKGTDQDGIYDKDPRVHLDAKKLDEITFDNLQSYLSESSHKAGMHQIIDPEAIKVLKRKRVKLIVVNGFKPQNILEAAKGGKVGTTVS